ncbi:Atu4866 domain-containing protein [Micromonospora rubida]|uniref:Atu4866 domain-containing protein n=1 Tax=Micromonospora rubida TaxID=2697657 RepID=UPI0038B3A120
MPAEPSSNSPYVGMWINSTGFIHQELTAEGRYDEARGEQLEVLAELRADSHLMLDESAPTPRLRLPRWRRVADEGLRWAAVGAQLP